MYWAIERKMLNETKKLPSPFFLKRERLKKSKYVFNKIDMTNQNFGEKENLKISLDPKKFVINYDK